MTTTRVQQFSFAVVITGVCCITFSFEPTKYIAPCFENVWKVTGGGGGQNLQAECHRRNFVIITATVIDDVRESLVVGLE